MRGFGEKGFAATSIREIAALAGSNIASISYHFGGKEGLPCLLCKAHDLIAVLRHGAGGQHHGEEQGRRSQATSIVRS